VVCRDLSVSDLLPIVGSDAAFLILFLRASRYAGAPVGRTPVISHVIQA
jgi:hypothetical protein